MTQFCRCFRPQRGVPGHERQTDAAKQLHLRPCRGNGQLYGLCFVRGHLHSGLTRHILFPVCHNGPDQRQGGQIRKVQMVGNAEQAGLQVHHLHVRRAIRRLHGQEAGRRTPVRQYEAVHTEIIIMRELAAVAAIPVTQNPIRVFRIRNPHGMVTPFPDASADKPRIPVNHLPVVLKASRTIAHGMGIFTHEIWPGILRLCRLILKALKVRIHPADHIHAGIDRRLIPSVRRIRIRGPLIMNRP